MGDAEIRARRDSSSRKAILTSKDIHRILRQCVVVCSGRHYDNFYRPVDDPNNVRVTFSDETRALAAQLVAELARSDLGRLMALKTKGLLVQAVGIVLGDFKPENASEEQRLTAEERVNRRQERRDKQCSLETAVQICRILGNLCYESEEGRRQVLAEPDVLKKLLWIAKDRQHRAELLGEDPGQRLPVILPGFLLNLVNGTPSAATVIGK